MKKTCLILAILTYANFTTSLMAQDSQEETTQVKYRRSSLYTLMVTDNEREHNEIIQQSFVESPIPDKFNNHTIVSRTVPKKYDETLSKVELREAQKEAISEYLNTNDIAKSMVSKWFNRSEKGGFNMDLISERGSYNATELDVTIAKSNKRGLSLLADAGEELIKNTFVVVNDFKYTNKEEIAKKANKWLSAVSSAASSVGADGLSLAAEATTAVADVAGKGYVIKTRSYLYKLVWNEEVAAIFYNDFWTDDVNFDEAKKIAFDATDIFKLELIGSEVAWADLQSSSFSKKTDEELIAVATVKSVDAVVAKLQKKYEVFRTKTPLYSGDPLSAQIGLKEGLEKGDKYEVLEQVINKEGKTVYERVGVIKVDKSQIWDNRYMASEDEESNDDVKEYTAFKGSKNKYYSGMLIRQIN